jgi:endoglycosylceramidase
MCGEGVPDFYAKEVVGEHPSCFSPIIDHLLEPVLDKFGICKPISAYGYRYDDNGDPLIEDCQSINFGIYYSSPDSINAFDALYKNKDGLRDKFVAFWDASSARFAKNRFVLGFDPFNEPAIGNYYRDPTLLLPGHMDRRSLAPLYTEVFEKYMANSDESIMWFEPNTFPNVNGIPFGDGLIPGIIFPAGFETPPGGEFGSKNHVFNDHTYCCQLNPNICTSGEPRADRAQQCYNWHKQRVGKRAADAERYGIPLHLTEFGACLTEGPCTQEIRQVTEIADEYLVGWAYWQFKTYGDLTTSAGTGSEGFYDPDGSLQTWKVKALSRTYLMNTQGVPTHQEFDMDTA